MTHFAQYESIKPWLKSDTPVSTDKERLQSEEDGQSSMDFMNVYYVHVVLLLSSYWWNGDKYLGPAILLQAYRWLVARDDADSERIEELEDPFKLTSLPYYYELYKAVQKG